jgi:predicted Rossmann fold flavoprotein
MQWLEELGQPMISPCPSLFTFNMPQESISEFMGIVAPKAIVRMPGSKIQGNGPLLITHWGLSGPAVLMLSAKAARILAEVGYQFECHVAWLGIIQEDKIRNILLDAQKSNGNRKLTSASFQELPKRLWSYLVEKSIGNENKTWDALSPKDINKLVLTLVQDPYQVSGKTTFKEEFVTAGGVDLKHVNFKNMESKILPGLYFAGEVLNIDGLTGGFNFQAAWTTAWLAARGAAQQ